MTSLRPTTTDELLHPARAAHFFENWDPDLTIAPLDLLCAELSRLVYAAPGIVESTLASRGFTGVHLVNSGVDLRRESHGTQVVIAAIPERKQTFVVFRGTESGVIDDVLTDARTLQAAGPAGSRVHSGFDAAYRAVRPGIQELLQGVSGRIVLCGHSLGGALANLAAIDRPESLLVTFGAPRVGDSRFADLLAAVAVRRYVNCCDIVPRVPPRSFDQPHLAELLTELLEVDACELPQSESLALGAAQAAGRIAARVIAKTFRMAGLEVEFRHAGRALYFNSIGELWSDRDEGALRADRQTARGHYRVAVHQAMPALNVERMFDRIAEVASGWRGGAMAPLRSLFDDLRKSATLANVVVRDFADHAPIRYVQAVRNGC